MDNPESEIYILDVERIGEMSEDELIEIRDRLKMQLQGLEPLAEPSAEEILAERRSLRGLTSREVRKKMRKVCGSSDQNPLHNKTLEIMRGLRVAIEGGDDRSVLMEIWGQYTHINAKIDLPMSAERKALSDELDERERTEHSVADEGYGTKDF